MIRPMVPGDKAAVLRLAKMFYEERMEKIGFHYSDEHAAVHFDLFISNSMTIALCAEEDGRVIGMIAGVISAVIFAKELAVQEMVWYVEAGRRKCGVLLLRAFERCAAERGARYVTMVGMSGDPVLEFYSRVGYESIQETFLKSTELF